MMTVDTGSGTARAHGLAVSSSAGPRSPAPAIVALALGGFAIGTSEFVTMGLLPQIASGIGHSIPSAGHVISAYALGVVVGAPLIAALAARVPRRAMLLALMTAYAAGNALTAAAPGYPSLLAARFLAGLPHGAYFGTASLVAASLVAPSRKGRAVGAVMLGLSVSQVMGVPVATWLGQHLGWRSAYIAVSAVSLLTVACVMFLVPPVQARQEASLRQELSALAKPQVLLTVLVGTIGFGGIFAVNSYIAPLVTEVTGRPDSFVPWVLLAFGIGCVLGGLVAGRLTDWNLELSLAAGAFVMTLILAVFGVAAAHAWTLIIASVLLSVFATIMVIALQMRLMHEAGESEMLGAALNHSSLNLANALGAWLGGAVIAAGLGYAAPTLVGAVLGAAGLAILAVALTSRRPVEAGSWR